MSGHHSQMLKLCVYGSSLDNLGPSNLCAFGNGKGDYFYVFWGWQMMGMETKISYCGFNSESH